MRSGLCLLAVLKLVGKEAPCPPRSEHSPSGREPGWSGAVSVHQRLGVLDDLPAFSSLEPAGLGRCLGQAELQEGAEGTISSEISHQVFALGLF